MMGFDSGGQFRDSQRTAGIGARNWGRHMGKTVLLIEDEPNIIEAIRFILSRDGWHVHTHSDGLSAFQTICETEPDVVILDVMLPGRSGFDILRDIRGAQATAALPVLMLTAKGQDSDRELATQIGASRFMTKPFSNTEVLASVRELTGA